MANYKQQLKGSLALAIDEARGKKSAVAACATIQNWSDRELRDRRVRATEEDRAAIARLKEEGWSVYAIADRVGLSQPTVRKLLKQMLSTGSRVKTKT